MILEPTKENEKKPIGIEWLKKVAIIAIEAYPELREIENPGQNLSALIQILGTLITVGRVGDPSMTYKELLDRENVATPGENARSIKETSSNTEQNLTVVHVLTEHMKLLVDRAANSTSETERSAYVTSSEDLQCLLNRLGTPEGDDTLLGELHRDNVYMALSANSKLIILKQANALQLLAREIARLAESASGSKKPNLSVALRIIVWFFKRWRW